jgi:hypothetical protein
MQRQSSRAGAPQLRKMFIKVIKDGSASFDARTDGPRFMRAALEFKDDPSDLLYCLTKPQVHSSHAMQVLHSDMPDSCYICSSSSSASAAATWQLNGGLPHPAPAKSPVCLTLSTALANE